MRNLLFILILFLGACMPENNAPMKVVSRFVEMTFEEGSEKVEFEAIARYDNANKTWSILDDAGHTPVNITGCTVGAGGALFLQFPQPVVETYGISADTDADFMAYQLGIGGHTNEVRIRFGVPGYKEIAGELQYDGTAWNWLKYPHKENATIKTQTVDKIVLEHIDCQYNPYYNFESGPHFWTWRGNPSTVKSVIFFSGVPVAGDRIYFNRMSVIPHGDFYRADELEITGGQANIWVRGAVKFGNN